jgi:molecular chaperone HtpG
MKQMGQEVPVSAPILEINPEHTIVKSLNSSKDESIIEDISWLLLDQARVGEGMDIKDPILFTKRLNNIMAKAL